MNPDHAFEKRPDCMTDRKNMAFRRRAETLAACAIAFAAGCATLLHETAWFRLLSLRLGSSAQAVAAVPAAFLAGMALGNTAFGRLADRSARRWFFLGTVQLAAAVFGFVGTKWSLGVLSVYAAAAMALGPDSWQAGAAAFAAGCAVVMAPAFFMGGAYPLLVRLMSEGNSKPNTAAALAYGMGSLGATLGAVLGGFLLLPRVGVNFTLRVAAWCNLFALILAVAGTVMKLRAGAAGRLEHAGERDLTAGCCSPGPSARMLLIVAFFSGFTALAMETLWMRMLALVIGHTAFSFSAVLSVYMAAVAAGGLLWGRRQAEGLTGLGRLGWMHAALAACCVASVLVTVTAPAAIQACYRASERASFGSYLIARVLVSAMVAGPSAFLMGALFPRIVSAYSAARGGTAPGWAAGWVSALATFGGIFGAILAEFGMAPRLGSGLSAAGVGCLNALVAAALLASAGGRMRGAGIAVLCCALGLTHVLRPALSRGGAVVARQFGARMVSQREDAAGTVTVLEKDGKRWIALNATPIMAPVSPERQEPTTDLVSGHLPMLLCPGAQDALFVGLGSGISLGAMSLYGARHLRTIEICPSVIQAAEFFAGANRGVLKDPRTSVTINDGRNQLFCERRRYDVIGFDDWIAVVNGATPMATVEFLEIVKSRLRRGGVYSSGPGSMDDFFRMELRTLLKVFDHVAVFVFPDTGCFYPVASNDPIVIDYQWIRECFQNPRTAESLAAMNLSGPEDFIAALVCRTEGTARLAGAGPLCTDDLPLTMYHPASCLNVDMFIAERSRQPDAGDVLDAIACGFEDPMRHVRCGSDARADLEARVRRARAALKEVLLGAFVLQDRSEKLAAFRRAKSLHPGCRYADFFIAALEEH